jgi:ABC-type transport system involved in multi-copper enzyme maturation permease subunit
MEVQVAGRPSSGAPETGQEDAAGRGAGTRMQRARDLVAAEWIKLFSVRSTYVALLLAAALPVFISLSVAHANVDEANQGMQNAAQNPIDPLLSSFRGLQIGQLIIGVLGAMAITGEYSSGLIRTTFAVKPQRAAVFAAKLAVVGAVTVLFGEILTFAMFLSTQVVLHAAGAGIGLGAPGALRAVLTSGLYFGIVAVLGLAFGAVMRHAAAVVATVFALLFLVPQIPGALPAPWSSRFAEILPSNAFQQISTLQPAAGLLSPGWSWAVLAAWAVGTPLLGVWVLRSRDA